MLDKHISDHKEIHGELTETLITDQSDFDTLFDQPSSPDGDDSPDGPESTGDKGKKEKTETPTLDSFGTWLSDQVKKGKLDPVYGREKELQRITQILSLIHI